MYRVIAALAAGAPPSAGCGAAHGRKAAPREGRSFTARGDNPWFPLEPGTTFVYRGVKDGKPSRDVVRVARRTATIDGVPCAVVGDRLYLAGKLEERTTDWYTQDDRGNVWYYGEDTAELDPAGRVTSTEGTWRAGRDGAQPGIYMPAHPKAGVAGRQEFLKGHAEDHFEGLGLHARVRVPAASSADALLTKETTPLEPGVVDHK